MCTTTIFDASIDCELIFMLDSLPKFVKICQIFRRLCSRLHNKSELVFATNPLLLGEGSGNFSGYSRLQKGGLAKVLFRGSAFSSIVFALCDALLRLS